MSRKPRRLQLLAAILLAIGLTMHGSVNAQAQSNDPGVAFVSTLDGDVTVQRGDSGELEAAGVNAPLMVGDSVSTGVDSRAEVQFDYGHVARVGQNAQFRFAALGRYDDTLQLAEGTVGIGVLHPTSQYAQVETPSVTVRPRAVGFYRVAIDPDGTTAITVRSGWATILLPQGTRRLAAGSTMLVWGPENNPSYRYIHSVNHDAFDQWNTDRDTFFARSNAYRYAASGIPGLYTLSAHGQWQNSPQYGSQWYPNVPNGWTPYSSGQWTYEPYYGWTWVDSAPWGYAPSHYGRWYRDQRRNRWAWIPGSRAQAQQAWSPALVAFIGFGGENIGWVPLAPSEQMHPWWGSASRSYTATNVTNIQSAYVNSRWPSAVRGLPRQSFANGGYERSTPVSRASITRAVVMRSALPVVPQPQALRYTQRAAPSVRAPSAQAFHAFKITPRALQTFTQQRSAATVVVQHANLAPVQQHAQPALPPQQHAQPVVPPQRPQPVVPLQHTQPLVPPQHTRPVVPLQRAQPVLLPPHAQPVVPPQRPQPVVPQRAQPVVPLQHAQPVVPPQRPQPVVPQRAQPVAPPQHAQPVLPPPHAQPVVPPQRPQPVVPQRAQPVVPPQHAQPVLPPPHAQPVVPPQRPQPVVPQRAQPVVPPQHAQPVLPPPQRAPQAVPQKQPKPVATPKPTP